MIVGSAKVSTSKSSYNNMVNHVSNHDDNEQVMLFDSFDREITKQQLKQLTQHFLEGAQANKDASCMMQFMFNSKEPLTSQQIFDFRDKICREFGVDEANHDVYLMQHKKALQGGGFEYHAHFLTNYRGFEHGKVIDTSFSKAREEKLARVFELEHGHEAVQGAHNIAVLNALHREGYSRVREMEERLIQDKDQLAAYREKQSRPRYSETGFKTAKGQGKGQEYKDLQQQAHDIFKACKTGKELQEALKESGFTLQKGDKAAFVLSKDGITLGSAGRAFGVKNALLRDILVGKKEILNKTEKTEVKRETANKELQQEEKKQEKQDEFKQLGFTEKQAAALMKLNDKIDHLEKLIDKFEGQKIDTDDNKLLRQYVRNDLIKNNKKPTESRIKRHVPKMKEKAEQRNDVIQSKINEKRQEQRQCLSKIESICNNNIEKHAKTHATAGKSKFSKGNKARPQNLKEMMRELGSNQKFAAASRFSNREHEYTKIDGSAPEYRGLAPS